jgi:hypothetical protein
MSTFTRVVKDPVGMARLVTNYSRIKEMQSKNLNIQDIAEIFDEDPTRLQIFVEYADALVSGEKSFSLSITLRRSLKR